MTESHEHESIQFKLSKELEAKVDSIYYHKDDSTLSVYTLEKPNGPIVSKVDTTSMRTTLEQFDKNVSGTLKASIKALCVYSIKHHLRKYVQFNDDEQEWYSENYPNDPGLVKNKEEEEKTKPKKIAINKYSGNGRFPLHESVIIGETPMLVTLPDNMVLEYIPKLDTTFGITYFPNG